MSKRREKRVRETNQQFEDAVVAKNDQEVVAMKGDDDLFMVDRAGSSNKRRRVQQEIVPKQEGTFMSKTEKHLVQKTVQRIQSGVQRKPYGSDVVELRKSGAKDAVQGKVALKVRDIWTEEEEGQPAPTAAARPHKKALKVAMPGQSYHPSSQDHQETLAQAVSLEMRRIEKGKSSFDLEEAQRKFQEQQKARLQLEGDSDDDDDVEDEALVNSSGTRPKYAVDMERLRKMTATITGEDNVDDEDEEDDSEDEEDGADNAGVKKQRRKEKLTRAQRNKQRSRKQALYEERRAAVEKRKSKDIERLRNIQKSLGDEAARRETERQIREVTLQQKQRDDEEQLTKRLRDYEISAVPLTDELDGSLRRLRPKGVALKDQTQSLITAGEMHTAFARKRRTYEKPHGGKRIKWFAKYKVA